MGALDLCLSVCVRSRAHTGFVGEQAALNALGDCLFDGKADRAADDCGGVERALEDEREGLGNILNAADNNNKSAEYIQDRHDGHELLGNRSNAVSTANEDKRADNSNYCTHDP